jgi:hypothetical protein
MGSVSDAVQQLRRLVPVRAIPGVARRRVAGLWDNDAFRSAQEDNMRFLLEFTDRVDEVPQLAREYAEFDVERGYRRWHPRHVSFQEVRGVEWMTTKRDHSRGVVLSFIHHGWYNGIVSSTGRAADALLPSSARPGVILHGVVAPEAFDPKAPISLRQHFKVCDYGPNMKLMSAGEGAGRMVELLEQGEVLAIAFDVAGRTPIKFLGRDMLGSFGAARMAVQTNSPVVILSSHQGADGAMPWVQVHEPIEPSEFPDPSDLLAEIIRQHEPAVLAWPAAYDSPFSRLGVAPPATV